MIDIGENMLRPKTVEATVEGFWKLVDDGVTGHVCSELADLLEQKLRGELSAEEYKKLKDAKKRECHFYTPHAHFNKGYKRGDCEPVDSGKVIIDLDGCAGFEQLYEQRLKGRERELGIDMVNRSVSGTGGHVLFEIPAGMTRQQAQAWMAHELGDVAYDKAVHELERGVYIPCREYILYIDEELMFKASPNPLQREVASGAEQPTPRKERAEGEAAPEMVSADERTRFIAKGVMKEKGLVESDFVNDGGRHTTVKMLLSGATQLLTKAEVNGVLSELMPDHWDDENIQTLVNDFYAKYNDPTQRLMKYQEELFVKSRRAYAGHRQGSDVQRADSTALCNQTAAPLEGTGEGIPPAMPTKLPKLIQLLTSRTPEVYKAAVAHAVFPPLATHLCDVRFTYTDNKIHEATLMNCLMAGTGTGKACIDKPIERIMADIERRDKENERRESEWKKDCQKRGANKDKLTRPEGLVIQIIDPDMTKPALVTRMDEAEGHFVYVKLNELDLFEQLKGQTGKQHFQLMCLAFDTDATYGQTRIGTQSVTARPMCRFNWNACTTILKGRRFFSRVLTDGPISRINFCTIPKMEIGAEQPVYGLYDAEFDEKLKPYIDNLVAARGMVDCPQATRLAKRLLQECAEFARLSQSDAYWDLSHRACVIAWLKACVLYVANGMKWERAIDEFVLWSLRYDLWCKMMFFGEDIERANNGDDARIGHRGPRNLLELLPDEFTLDDAKRVRRQQGMDTENTRKMVSQWKSREYILQLTVDSFKKSEKYKGRVRGDG